MKSTLLPSTIQNNTMCSAKRIETLRNALDAITAKGIEGDFVECGTWRGGLAALMLHYAIEGSQNRKLYIYDTFEGMPEPGQNDHPEAIRTYNDLKDGQYSNWCRAGLNDVVDTLMECTPDYLDHCYLIQGMVEDTLNHIAPTSIALCRLDTDWYSSTKKELEVLYPKVVSGGYIIVDDYSDWPGCKQACDEYLSNELDHGDFRLHIEDGSLVIQKL